MTNLQNKMAEKVTIYPMVLYQILNVLKSTFYLESFMLLSKIEQFCTMLPYYKQNFYNYSNNKTWQTTNIYSKSSKT